MEKDSDASFLGAELRRARLAAGIGSPEELAGRLGFHRTVIAKAESGLRPPSPDVAEAYAREFPELNALIRSGLIERWADYVKKNGGYFPGSSTAGSTMRGQRPGFSTGSPSWSPELCRSKPMPARS